MNVLKIISFKYSLFRTSYCQWNQIEDPPSSIILFTNIPFHISVLSHYYSDISCMFQYFAKHVIFFKQHVELNCLWNVCLVCSMQHFSPRAKDTSKFTGICGDLTAKVINPCSYSGRSTTLCLVSPNFLCLEYESKAYCSPSIQTQAILFWEDIIPQAVLVSDLLIIFSWFH